MKRMKFTTCSGLPANVSRSRGSCVATPTGQVFRWQTRIMMQPSATSGAVAKPNSSAPSSAAIDDVAAGLQLAVRLHGDAAAQVVEHQRLMRLGEPELPRQARVLDRGLRRGAGAAVVSADQHHVGVRLGDAGGDRADADLGDQLHADAGVAVAVLQVVDQLRQILDGVDVVVRRRRDQPDSGGRVPGLGDPRIDLGAGQLAALAGLRALRHLDLQLACVDEVLAGHAEAAGGHLLDGASSSSRRSAASW